MDEDDFHTFEWELPEYRPFVPFEVNDFKSEYKSWKKLERKIRLLALQEESHVALVVSDESCKVFKSSSRTKMFDEDDANYRFVGGAHINWVEKIGENGQG